MAEQSQILLVDAEESFVQSTADLLRRQGYQCDCVLDVPTAVQMLRGPQSEGFLTQDACHQGALRRNTYDLLIAGIDMPGNLELELVSVLPDIAEGIPVILVADYPSLNSAIQAVELRVQAYLVKPIDFEKLLVDVHIAIEHFQTYRAVQAVKQRLQYWYEDLANVEKILSRQDGKMFGLSTYTFLELTFQNIVDALSDLKHLTGSLAGHHSQEQPCHLLNCPALKSLSDGLVETIDVLEKSKNAFKSKDLGQIRRKLETLVNNKA